MQSTLLLPGTLIGEKYRLLRHIGEGTMGVVWAAANEATSREVALKLLLRSEPELRNRLLREARACGALKHPNIIDIYDVAQTAAGEPFLVMELLSGETLAQVLEARRRLDAAEATRIAQHVARALDAAHTISIVHRDLKPANVFLCEAPGAEEGGSRSSTLAWPSGCPRTMRWARCSAEWLARRRT